MKVNNPNITYKQLWDFIMNDLGISQKIKSEDYRKCWRDNTSWSGDGMKDPLSEFSLKIPSSQITLMYYKLKQIPPGHD